MGLGELSRTPVCVSWILVQPHRSTIDPRGNDGICGTCTGAFGLVHVQLTESLESESGTGVPGPLGGWTLKSDCLEVQNSRFSCRIAMVAASSTPAMLLTMFSKVLRDVFCEVLGAETDWIDASS